ncbi:hypothetical protein HK103_004565 [Boothiomyces macroporosus]|uniref:Short-chain dehydrogenase n=1 Tax=Boothiomyces macroporosus TaxID=261099 RepID=A0AAD5Y3A1_9FUNG|nr:hypothetical protein HK103_004565 [Boothiomyces macroporosus]
MNNWTGHTILITGGGTGIGLAFAKRLLQDGNKVILVGRRKDVLEKVKQETPAFEYIVGDVGSEQGRIDLYQAAITRFPTVNVIFNNAGIQRLVQIQNPGSDWKTVQSEIDINLSAPIHLSILFSDHLLKQPSAAIINVTSGLSFIPYVNCPVYASTKAALHSFTWSLRSQYKNTNVKIIEVVPPAVDTDLQAPGLHKFGVNVDVFADSVYGRLKNGEDEVGYGMAEESRVLFKDAFSHKFNALNNH